MHFSVSAPKLSLTAIVGWCRRSLVQCMVHVVLYLQSSVQAVISAVYGACCTVPAIVGWCKRSLVSVWCMLYCTCNRRVVQAERILRHVVVRWSWCSARPVCMPGVFIPIVYGGYEWCTIVCMIVKTCLHTTGQAGMDRGMLWARYKP
jgi:hypothetical protein